MTRAQEVLGIIVQNMVLFSRMRKVLREHFLQKSDASLNASHTFFPFAYISGYLKVHFLPLPSLFYDVLT